MGQEQSASTTDRGSTTSQLNPAPYGSSMRRSYTTSVVNSAVSTPSSIRSFADATAVLRANGHVADNGIIGADANNRRSAGPASVLHAAGSHTASRVSQLVRQWTRPEQHSRDNIPAQITVVHRDAQNLAHRPEQDPVVLSIRDIPQFMPLLRSSITGNVADDIPRSAQFSNMPSVAPSNARHHPQFPPLLRGIDPQQIRILLFRMQQHVDECAEDVVFKQRTLHDQIRKVDASISSQATVLAEKQKKLLKFNDYFETIEAIGKRASTMNQRMTEVREQLSRLNTLLPKESQLPALDVWVNSSSGHHSAGGVAEGVSVGASIVR